MALSSAFLSEDQFSCSICLDVFTNPVSTPCGHSFCQACISSYWDGKAGGGGSKSYMCPLCKETFRKRPELHINRTLKEITEQFKQMATTGAGMGRREEEPNPHPHRSQRQSLSSPLRPGEMPESVFAEMMNRFQRPSTTGSPPPAYPQTNASQYTLSGPGDSSSDLPLCPAHMRGLEFFCRTDQTCICSVCLERAEHRGHNAIPAKREWHIKKSQLGITEVELKDLISERERKMEEIQKSLQDIQHCAVIFQNISYISFYQVIEMARRAAEHRAKSLLRELEQEIAELKKRSTTLNQLAQSEDYILFLKTFPALSSIPPTKDWSDARVVSELTSGVVLKTVTQMMERFQEELHKLPEICKSTQSCSSLWFCPQSVKIQEYIDQATDITLDPHTAHPRLMISVDGKQVCCSDRYQPVPDNPERFDRVVCVLAREGFNSGRHYWEVEVGGKTDWDLGVASRSINRKGKITVSPAHGYWFLSLRDQVDYAFRTEPSTSLEVPIRPSRVGIYVDCDKGLLSFYNVEAKVLIYTFTDSFPDTIHPFFSPCTNKSGRNEAPLIICPVAPTE
uniref:Bloodthirsty-related gene family, member 1 n=1 Tax=Myripristis murdjan TaxID=586833 RepID=A0A667WJV5_9TELE